MGADGLDRQENRTGRRIQPQRERPETCSSVPKSDGARKNKANITLRMQVHPKTSHKNRKEIRRALHRERGESSRWVGGKEWVSGKALETDTMEELMKPYLAAQSLRPGSESRKAQMTKWHSEFGLRAWNKMSAILDGEGMETVRECLAVEQCIAASTEVDTGVRNRLEHKWKTFSRAGRMLDEQLPAPVEISREARRHLLSAAKKEERGSKAYARLVGLYRYTSFKPAPVIEGLGKGSHSEQQRRHRRQQRM